jgi:hypothetical protein
MPPDNETNVDQNEHGHETPSDGEILLNLIFKKKVRCYIDKTGEPCVILPRDRPKRGYPIQSRRVRAFVAALAWNTVKLLPSTAELDRVLRVLEGLAWQHAPRDATRDQLWHNLQDKPVLQVVIEFMRERDKHETQMQALLKDLGELALQLKFNLYSKQWPKTAAHLSAHLRQEHNQGILQQCGVAVEITRDKNGAKVILKSVTPSIAGDDAESSASPMASPNNPPSRVDLGKSDAGDTHILQLEDQICNRFNKHDNHEQAKKVNE